MLKYQQSTRKPKEQFSLNRKTCCWMNRFLDLIRNCAVSLRSKVLFISKNQLPSLLVTHDPADAKSADKDILAFSCLKLK
ncbi:MAG: hypothetical protein QF788_03830 [SAR324 cluster bacterium]|nr:hypothetical protein [SAR324 cluster bacterium]